jgi:glycerol-3-phosphate cytidylyltransferase
MIKLYTGGTFDILHPGHINFLKKCKAMADMVIVSLNTDEFCKEYKRKPLMTYRERKACLLGCKYVDGVVENTGGYDSKPAILKVKPDLIAHGDDWVGPSYLKQLKIDSKFLKKNGIKLVQIPYSKGISTTKILKRCKHY